MFAKSAVQSLSYQTLQDQQRSEPRKEEVLRSAKQPLTRSRAPGRTSIVVVLASLAASAAVASITGDLRLVEPRGFSAPHAAGRDTVPSSFRARMS
jgi:hypothetical protein